MAKSEGIENKEIQRNVAVQIPNFPRNLLQRLSSYDSHPFLNGEEIIGEEQNENSEIELSLGLSLNGRFGTDPKSKNKLTRSTSIPDVITNPTAKNGVSPANLTSSAAAALVRTCSLPVETEEEWRKRKELQSLRRLEAKRKRSEKQRGTTVRAFREIPRWGREEGSGENGGKVVGEVGVKDGDGIYGFAPSPCSGGGGGGGGGGGLSSNGGGGSQGSSGSSGISELENHTVQGTESRSPPSIQSLSKPEQNPPASETPDKRQKQDHPVAAPQPAGSAARAMLEDMPCVSTRGDGPNGRRIQGFLYRYQKGEEVRIVCVCHGKFLSPAEFVKHAGGGDVANPMRHIVVNPSSFL